VDPGEESLVCKHCGSTRLPEARFCTKCGGPTESSSETSSLSQRISVSREAILVAGARCTATKMPFAIRFEQGASGIWQACAAFAISERQLSNPAFSSDQVTSSASLSPSYPGCPHCGADARKELAGASFVQCSCGRLACNSGVIGAETICPWCGRAGILERHGPLAVFGIKDR
jgi:TerY-C metal binding domain